MTINIKDIQGVGPKTLESLQHLGISTKEHILQLFPKRYVSYFLDDIENIKKGKLINPPVLSRHNVFKTSFKLDVNGVIISCVAYQQPYLKHVLDVGAFYIVKGKFDTKKKIFIVSQLKPIRLENQMVADYDLKDIPNYRIQNILKTLLQTEIKETISDDMLEKLHVMPIDQAYQGIHFPKNENDVEEALKRFKLQELLHLFEGVSKQKKRQFLTFDQPFSIQEKTKSLPFKLTKDQENIVLNIIKDSKEDIPLKHLIQGDVGSGKTIIALIIASYFIAQGYQVALMVPTEILARQHVETVQTLFKHINVSLLTSTIDFKDDIMHDIHQGNVELIIGTHILASSSLSFHQLGLVMIDEQQKFGVEIRKSLIEKARDQDVIYLTATPIPRTLLRSILGDAKIYTLHTMPIGKQPIKTISVSYDALNKIMEQLQRALENHQHIFVVVPAIDSDRVTYNVMHTYHVFKQRFQQDIFVLHGQMPKHEQQRVMDSFRKQKQGILISTQMIEVGVDIKTATFMLILEAEYFGLSQLHQLRGRLGRGQLKGVCYLISNQPNDERFTILEQTSSGFEISEQDLYTRGPGDMLGLIQSGRPPFKHIDFIEDGPFIQKAYDVYLDLKNKDTHV